MNLQSLARSGLLRRVLTVGFLVGFVLSLDPVALTWAAEDDAFQTAPAFVIDRYRTRAEAGDTRAMIRLAVLYERGYVDGAKDLKSAAFWYGEAADRGDAEAQFTRARYYAEGLGGPKDLAAAAAYYRKAAEQGVGEAQYNLAILLLEGTGVDQDLQEAIRWYEQAAFRGVVPAMRALGVLYAGSIGDSRKDAIEAWAWLSLAAENGDAEAEARLPAVRQKLNAEAAAEAEQLLQAYRQLRIPSN